MLLPRALLETVETIQMYLYLLSALVLNAIALYWTLIPTAVLLVVFIYLIKWYLNAAQAVKRLEGTTKSPVFGMINSTISGISTIRCYESQDRLLTTFDNAQVELKDAVPALDYKVAEGGSNFSMGQRQLLCLARAVLRSNKILIMDEATANVDPQTDALIQKTIRVQFDHCTVLTIAHRLNTIIDSDRVLVMDKGEAVEFDYPHILLSKPTSIFSFMVHETGESTSKMLRELAKEKYDSIYKNA